jgi:hypothetical protein
VGTKSGRGAARTEALVSAGKMKMNTNRRNFIYDFANNWLVIILELTHMMVNSLFNIL